LPHQGDNPAVFFILLPTVSIIRHHLLYTTSCHIAIVYNDSI
jgi:hypothetical protein